MNIKDCYNFNDFRKLAKKRLPSPIFHYIDGGADDEATLKRNTDAFNDCDLVPNVLASVGKPDLSTTVFGKKIDMPLFLSRIMLISQFTFKRVFCSVMVVPDRSYTAIINQSIPRDEVIISIGIVRIKYS